MTSPHVTRLVVFSDDWGRHPSSCQHLVRHLLPRYKTLWVNTIGMRPPRLSREDLGKAWDKFRSWFRGWSSDQRDIPALPENLFVINPFMWPGFRSAWQMSFNAARVSRAVNSTLGARQSNEYRIAVTTLPITADLVGRIDIDRWVYYCVDDFSVWPGLDGQVLETMEARLAQRVDHAIAASQTLGDRLERLGRSSQLLTHGIDLEHWSAAQPATPPETEHKPLENRTERSCLWWETLSRPIILFWGLIDERLDANWCRTLAASLRVGTAGMNHRDGTLVLVGPTQSPHPGLQTIKHLVMPGPTAYEDLPRVAAASDVLIMPYVDKPVTRAMQPLKFKEYLATGKPVVVRDLPATQPWSDAADVVSDVNRFVEIVLFRAQQGVPRRQVEARRRLNLETWERKASQFEAMILGRESYVE